MIVLIPSSQDGTGGGGRPGTGGAAVSGTPGQVRVLVVEDEWIVAMELESVLEDAGYAVVGVAITAREAVRMAELYTPDLVTMDIHLRGAVDGIEAALEIHRRLGLRCLFVTAHSDERVRQRAEAASPLGWLPKPFSDRQLVEALEAAVRQMRG